MGGFLRTRSFIANCISPVKDFFFPPLCFSCNNRLADTESRVCHTCWQSIEKIHPDDHTAHVMHKRFLEDGSVDEFYSCYYFQEGGVFQKLVHSLKYDAITTFGIELGRHIGATMNAQTDVCAIDALVPVPLYKLKQRERGYNQSESLCQGIAQVLHRPVALSLVKRLKNTVSQTHLSAEERNQNVGDAFEVSPLKRHLVQGKTLLIVDDVITTGSTIQSVARVLKSAGAARVIAASAAIAKLDSK